MKRFCVFPTVLLLTLCIASIPVMAAETDKPASKPAFIGKKTFLSRPPDNTLIFPESIASSPDMTQVAYVANREDSEQMQVVVNNTPGKVYDHIVKGYPFFSPQNNRIGYIADKAGGKYVIIGKKEYPGYDGVCCLRFSPDGQHFAYIAEKKEKQVVFQDGKPHKGYDAVDRIIGPVFSPNSKHLAYVARQADGSVVLVLDDRESRPYDAIKKVIFSPDGKHLACLATRQKTFFALRDNKEIGPYDMVDSPVWSPNSQHLALIAINKDKWLIIKDAQELPAGNYDILVKRVTAKAPWYFKGFIPDQGRIQAERPRTMPPQFSPDSSRLAWAINNKNRYRLTVDGAEGPLFDEISEPVFSPNSRHFAYVGKITNQYINKEIMIIDGKTGPAYDFIGAPVFSPDSQHLAYRAMKGNQWFIVRDGKEQASYDAVLRPVFSGDSRHIAYGASRGKGHFIITDNKANGPYKALTTPFFSEKGNHLIYIAATNDAPENEQYFLVGDSHKGTLRFFSHIGVLPKNPLTRPGKAIKFIGPSRARTIVAFIEADRLNIYQLDIHFN